MRILLTNDDGITAPGMEALVRTLSKEHTLLVCAPDSQRSANSHAINCFAPLYVNPHTFSFAPQVEAYSCSGTPADCTKMGEGNLFEHIDIVLSGINNGMNAGTDTIYSGTCGAAREGALLGLQSVALSLHTRFAPGECHFDTAARVGLYAVAYAHKHPLPFGQFYNINVPDLPFEALKGFKHCSLAHNIDYPRGYTPIVDDEGRPAFRMKGGPSPHDPTEDSDYRWVEEGYVTLSVLSSDAQVSGYNIEEKAFFDPALSY